MGYLAIKVFPVPGGPYKRMPLHAEVIPVKSWGYFKGKVTAYMISAFALYSPIMLSKGTLGFSLRIYLRR
jgi:hypothetical protein